MFLRKFQRIYQMIDYKSIKIICDTKSERSSLNLLIIYKLLYIIIENKKISIKNKTKFYHYFLLLLITPKVKYNIRKFLAFWTNIEIFCSPTAPLIARVHVLHPCCETWVEPSTRFCAKQTVLYT